MDVGGLELWFVTGEYVLVYMFSGKVNKTGIDAPLDESKSSLFSNG